MSHSAAGSFWFIFCIRAALALVYVGVPGLLVGASVWWATRRTRAGALAGHARRTRNARLAGIGAGAVMGVLAAWAGYGQLAPVSVSVGYLFGVLAGELAGVPAPSGPVRVADLRPRAAASYFPRWMAPVAVTAAVLTAIAPAVFAVAPPVRYGPWSPGGGMPTRLPGGTTVWPPASMTVPLAVVAVLALLTGGLLMRRVALLPPAAAGRPDIDEVMRRNTGRAVSAAVVAIELLLLAVTAIGGSAGLAVPGPVGGAAYLASRIVVWTGLGLAAAALVTWCVMGWWKRAPAEPSLAGRPRPTAT